ncbi:MAG: response regulator transcription factor [Candidatus Nanoarchaeia archaeon]
MPKKKILVAEDEESISELLDIILRESYNLSFVKDGESVLQEVKNVRPHLLLLDVMMPGMNGYQICENIRKDASIKDLKVAILSAKGQERDILTGLKSGADYYLTKPFDPNELKKKIDEIIVS